MRRGIDQLCVGEGEVAVIRAAGGHGEFDAAHAGVHEGADLEQLERDGAAGRTVTRAASPDGTGEYVRARIGKPSERPKLGTLRRANAASAKLSCADSGHSFSRSFRPASRRADRMGAGLADTAVTGQRL